jgi:hypothetical protein
MKRDSSILLGAWLVLAAFLFALGWQNLTAPGLFYDEAIYGGLARDFLIGHAPGGHMPGTATVAVFDRPFPLFVQPYLGALKCWLLLPIFKLLGATLPVLRAANLAFSAAALLLCMLWTWRLLGLAEALLAGLLLTLDPAFFFLGTLDWGSWLPSLLCRLGGFYLALLAWRRQQASWALAAGLVFGLGLFNKIDFGVILAGTALAALLVGGRSIGVAFRERPKVPLAALLGFLLGAGPVLALSRVILRAVFAPQAAGLPGELPEKLHTLGAMYDGSYFYRLMDAGGLFDKMYQAPSAVWTPFGLAVVIAALVLAGDAWLCPPESALRRAKVFVLLSAAFVTLGALALPGAVRLHHTTLVYPFPHLLIAAAGVAVWHRRWRAFAFHRTARVLMTVLALLVAVCSLAAVQRTQDLIRETGGRGWWSDALVKFAREINPRSDVTVGSLDWGFNEPLEFLTDGPRLAEPFWQAARGQTPVLPRDSHHVYLAHPPEFSLSPLGSQFLESVARQGTNASVHAWCDRQGKVAFYSVSFTAP